MGLMAKGNGTGHFDPVPEDTHIARCTIVCDLGVQQTPWGSKEQVYLGFEVPKVRVEWQKDDQKHEGPALIGKIYTLSIHEKSVLGQHLESWRGKTFTEEERKGFDLFNVLDAPCMISVSHRQKGDKVYANIASIMKVPAGTEIPDAENELVGYTATDSRYSGTLDKLPNWLKDKALNGQRQSPVEPDPAAAPANNPVDAFDDDIPF